MANSPTPPHTPRPPTTGTIAQPPPPELGPQQNPWTHYYAQNGTSHAQARQYRTVRRRRAALAILIVAALVVPAVGAALAEIKLNSLSASKPPVPLAGFTGTNCDGGDVGSASRTDPWPYGTGIPACTVHQYPTTVPGLTASVPTLAHIDSRTLLWAMLKRQDTQPVSSTLHANWPTPHLYSTNFPTAINTELVQIDYSKRAFVNERTDVNIRTGTSLGNDFFRCVGRNSYSWSAEDGWTSTEPDQQSNSTCNRLNGDTVADSFSTDGVATGGLTATQADAFFSYLDHITGLITTTPLHAELGSDGRNYIVLDVQVTPQDPRNTHNVNPSIDLGMGFFQAAFAQTGLSVVGWPYNIGLGPAQGVKIRYYVDPDTLLPAYSVMMATAPIVASGKTPFSPYEFPNTYTVNEYSYPHQLDSADMQPSGTPTLPVKPWPFPRYTFS